MTIKQDIEREAKKLGNAVRAATEEFVAATGMRPEISMGWVTIQQLQDSASDLSLGRVTIEVGGIEVTV